MKSAKEWQREREDIILSDLYRVPGEEFIRAIQSDVLRWAAHFVYTCRAVGPNGGSLLGSTETMREFDRRISEKADAIERGDQDAGSDIKFNSQY